MKCEQLLRRSITGKRLKEFKQPRADPASAEKVTLRRQKRQFVGHVNAAEVSTELDTVENRQRLGETNMLWPQVAMPFDDPAAADALVEKPWLQVQEPRLKSVNS